MSYDIAMQIDVPAAAQDVYAALTTTAGVAGWWTTRNETEGRPGEIDRFWFPGMLLRLAEYTRTGTPTPFFVHD